MKVAIAVISFVLLTACNNSPVKHIVVKSTAVSYPDSLNDEYFDWANAKINETIPMICSFDEAIKFFGKPDSVSALTEGVNGSFYRKKFCYCYFKALTFEKFSDTLVFSALDFSRPTRFYISDGMVRLNKWTTAREFEKRFPFTSSNDQLSGTYEGTIYLRVHTARVKTNDAWYLDFHYDTGLLWGISYIDPHPAK